jgi:hypothetical protein
MTGAKCCCARGRPVLQPLLPAGRPGRARPRARRRPRRPSRRAAAADALPRPDAAAQLRDGTSRSPARHLVPLLPRPDSAFRSPSRWPFISHRALIPSGARRQLRAAAQPPRACSPADAPPIESPTAPADASGASRARRFPSAPPRMAARCALIFRLRYAIFEGRNHCPQGDEPRRTTEGVIGVRCGGPAGARLADFPGGRASRPPESWRKHLPRPPLPRPRRRLTPPHPAPVVVGA